MLRAEIEKIKWKFFVKNFNENLNFSSKKISFNFLDLTQNPQKYSKKTLWKFLKIESRNFLEILREDLI